MRHSPENIEPDLNNIISISSRDHQDQNHEGRDNSSEGPPDSNTLSSPTNQRNGHL